MIFINEANHIWLVTIYEANQLSRDACLTYFSYKNVFTKKANIQYYNLLKKYIKMSLHGNCHAKKFRTVSSKILIPQSFLVIRFHCLWLTFSLNQNVSTPTVYDDDVKILLFSLLVFVARKRDQLF